MRAGQVLHENEVACLIVTAGDNLRSKAARLLQTLCGFKGSPGSAASGYALKTFLEPVVVEAFEIEATVILIGNNVTVVFLDDAPVWPAF